MTKPSFAVLAAALCLPALAADFEGFIEARMTMTSPQEDQRGSGTFRMHVGKAGTRMETKMTSPMGEFEMTALSLRAKPGTTYLVNDEKKLYSEITSSDEGADEPEEKLTVKKLAPERVAGYECAHALLIDASGEETEIWASRALGSAQGFFSAMSGGEDRREGKRNRETARALREAGIDGWPLRFRSKQQDGQVVTWEAVKVEKRSVPASLLSLSGYTKAPAGAATMGKVKLSPEQQRKMDEAMKDQRRQMQDAMKQMTPEQRKQMEELMRSMQQGGDGDKDD